MSEEAKGLFDKFYGATKEKIQELKKTNNYEYN